MKKLTALDWISSNIKSEDLNENRTNLGLNKRVQKRYDDNTVEDTASSIAVFSPEDFRDLVYKEIEKYFRDLSDHSEITTSAIDYSIQNAIRDDIRTPSYFLRFYGHHIKMWDEYEYTLKIAIYIDKGQFSYGLAYKGRTVIDLCGYSPSEAHPLTMLELEKAMKALRKRLSISRATEVNESNLDLNKHVQKKFQDVDAIENISEYVDLGLPSGILWCKHNYGVQSEEEYGEYYTFYNAQKIDGIPSKEDFEELFSYCDNEWVSVNGIYGRKFTSKMNGQSVFFPAGGICDITSIWSVNSAGSYWSSTNNKIGGYSLNFGKASVYHSCLLGKDNKLSVRTVQRKMEESSLGLNKRIQKKYDDKSAVEEVTKSFVSSLADFKKYIKDTFDELYKDDPKKIIKLYNSSSVACGGFSVASVTFDEYTDLTGHFFSPRFYMVYGYNEKSDEVFSKAVLDFRTDTSGSGNLNSREFSLYRATTTPESVENLSVCLKNIKKIAGKPSDFYPAQYSKKAYEALVNGFCTESYNPQPAAKEPYINREDLISYFTSETYYDNGLDFVKAFTDLYDGYVRINVKVIYDFKSMSDKEFINHMKEYIPHGFLADFGGTIVDQDILKYKKTYDKLSGSLWRIEVIDLTKQRYIMVIFNPDIHRIKDISTIKEAQYAAEMRMFEDVSPETIKADKDKYRKVYTNLYGSTEGSPMFNQYVDDVMTFIGRNKRARVYKSMVERVKPEV